MKEPRGPSWRAPGRFVVLALLALPLCGLYGVRAAASTFVDVELQAGTDDNVGRSEKGSDIEQDRFAGAQARVGEAVEIGRGTGLSISATLRAVEFRRFRDLSEVTVGAGVSLKHKFGLGPEAPWIGALGDAEVIDSDSQIRDGERYGLGIRGGMRIGERWGVVATLRRNWRQADEDEQRLPPNRPVFAGVVPSPRGDVFEFDDTELSLSADYQFDNTGLLLLSYSIRDGDVTSTARPNATIVGAAKAITSDAAVFGPGRSAYRLGALTHTASVGFNYPFSDSTSVELGYEYQRTDADAGIRYDRNLLRLRLLWAY